MDCQNWFPTTVFQWKWKWKSVVTACEESRIRREGRETFENEQQCRSCFSASLSGKCLGNIDGDVFCFSYLSRGSLWIFCVCLCLFGVFVFVLSQMHAPAAWEAMRCRSFVDWQWDDGWSGRLVEDVLCEFVVDVSMTGWFCLFVFTWERVDEWLRTCKKPSCKCKAPPSRKMYPRYSLEWTYGYSD
jgi:hypothetical protein